MTNPIDVTEETGPHPEQKPKIAAKPGIQKCRISVPPNGDSCVAAAACRVVWPDGDETPACEDCATLVAQIAGSHRASVKIERRR